MITHDDMVNMVRQAAAEVFTTMLAMDPEPGDAYMNSTASVKSNGVVSLVGLAGGWVGTGSISCTPQCACHLAGQLMMSEYDAINDEVLDAMAEVTNMIIGNVKTLLEERLGPLGLSIPTVIYGRNFSSRTVGQQDWTIVPFMAGGETIEIQLCLAPNKDVSRPRPAVADQPQAVEV
jgi:chemotaxis protein CheX